MPREYVLERTQTVARPIDDAFAFFGDAWNLEAITPTWLRFEIEEAPELLERGSRLRYRLRLFGVAVRWETEIAVWDPPRGFTDVQLRGPYPFWAHEHELVEVEGGTEIRDRVRYRVPGGPAAPLVQRILGRWLDAIFDYRAERLRDLIG